MFRLLSMPNITRRSSRCLPTLLLSVSLPPKVSRAFPKRTGMKSGSRTRVLSASCRMYLWSRNPGRPYFARSYWVPSPKLPKARNLSNLPKSRQRGAGRAPRNWQSTARIDRPWASTSAHRFSFRWLSVGCRTSLLISVSQKISWKGNYSTLAMNMPPKRTEKEIANSAMAHLVTGSHNLDVQLANAETEEAWLQKESSGSRKTVHEHAGAIRGLRRELRVVKLDATNATIRRFQNSIDDESCSRSWKTTHVYETE